MKAPALNAREQNNETLKASSSVGHANTFHVAVLRACVLGAVHRINSVAFCVFRLWAVWLVSKSSQGNAGQGIKGEGSHIIKKKSKGALHPHLSLVFQRCLSLGKLEHFGRHSSSFFGKKIFT